MVSRACSKMKPATPMEELMYATYRNNTNEKNAINIVRWYERRKVHFMALTILEDHFKGIRYGRT